MRASAVDGVLGDGEGEADVGSGVGVAEAAGELLVGAALVEPGAGGEVVHAARAAHASAAAPTLQDMTRRTRPGYVARARAPVSVRLVDQPVIRSTSCCGW